MDVYDKVRTIISAVTNSISMLPDKWREAFVFDFWFCEELDAGFTLARPSLAVWLMAADRGVHFDFSASRELV